MLSQVSKKSNKRDGHFSASVTQRPFVRGPAAMPGRERWRRADMRPARGLEKVTMQFHPATHFGCAAASLDSSGSSAYILCSGSTRLILSGQGDVITNDETEGQ
jgi:hypothetical protein